MRKLDRCGKFQCLIVYESKKVAILSRPYEESAYCQRVMHFVDRSGMKLLPIIFCQNYVPNPWFESDGYEGFELWPMGLNIIILKAL